MRRIRLISTDFDGTLVPLEGNRGCSPAFAEALDAHAAHGGLWAINTGRSLPHVLEGLASFRSPVAPDFLLVNERDVYRHHEEIGWVAHGAWNEACRQRHAELFAEAGKIFAFLDELAAAIPHFTVLYEDDLPAGLITSTEDVMDRVAGEISRAAAHHPDFAFQRNTIYLRFCHREYHKGSALRELCRLEGLDRREVFAAGDHFNDLSMLDGRFAAMTACPANAIEPVKACVRQSGGWVAGARWADGVAEALRHFAWETPAAATPATNSPAERPTAP
jgi:hydroxymethylpyrimidine pyrophosphatase-like HAD family hydrolase